MGNVKNAGLLTQLLPTGGEAPRRASQLPCVDPPCHLERNGQWKCYQGLREVKHGNGRHQTQS